MTEIQGRVLRITFHNPETGYMVARLKSGKIIHTITGRLPDVHVGQDLKISGKIVEHAKFGRQLEVGQYEVITPQDMQGIIGYLGSGLIKGIGPKTASRIVEHLGHNTLEIIQNTPEMLCAVPGIGKKTAARITQGVRSHGDLREFMVFLQNHGLAVSTSLRIWRHYGPDALQILKTEPHRLAQDMRGIGFMTADRIARQIGLPFDHPSRLQAGLLHVLFTAQEEGHTCLPKAVLLEQASHLLDMPENTLQPVLAGLDVAFEPEHPLHLTYLTPLRIQENSIARNLLVLQRRPGLLAHERIDKAIDWAEQTLGFSLSPSQHKALQSLLGAGLGVLSGGPGTGKTTLVRAIITIAQRMGIMVALAAPTGRAAKRLGESCQHEASTLHRLLEYKDGRFMRGRDNPLTYGLVVVDETSMLDTWMAANLLNAIGPATRLLLVGDVAQLPSVGPGLVLQQIIESQVAVVAYLQEIFRQQEASLIVANAHRVLHGLMPQTSNEKNGDFFFFPQTDPQKAASLIVDLVTRRLPRSLALNPIEDMQVLSPMHRGGLGCSQLNLLLRQEINPSKQQTESNIRVGDKVIQVRNNYDLEVFNGDIGLVETQKEGVWQVRMGDKLVSYSLAQLDDLNLAYAITVHKAQGSEYPVVVVALGQEHHILLNRSLLYTALTRGRKLVIVVGHPHALQKAVNNQESSQRFAGLTWRISKLL